MEGFLNTSAFRLASDISWVYVKSAEIDGDMLILGSKELSEPIHLMRKVIGRRSLIVYPYASKGYIESFGFGKDWTATLRDYLMKDGIIWTGAEMESVEFVIKTGRKVRLTNVECPPPFELTLEGCVDLEKEMGLYVVASGDSNFLGGSIRNIPTNDEVNAHMEGYNKYVDLRDCDGMHISREENLKRSTMAFCAPLAAKCTQGVLVIMITKKMPVWGLPTLLKARSVILISPEDQDELKPEDRINHYRSELTLAGLESAFDNFAIPLSTLRRSIVYIDSTPSEFEQSPVATKTRESNTSDILKSLQKRGARVYLRMPLIEGREHVVPFGKLLMIPFGGFGTRELMIQVQKGPLITRQVKTENYYDVFSRFDELQAEMLTSQVIKSRLLWLAVSEVRHSSFVLDSHKTVGMLSISNRSNNLGDIMAAVHGGLVMTGIFTTMLRSHVKKDEDYTSKLLKADSQFQKGDKFVRTELVSGRVYVDHTFDALDQKWMKFMYPISAVASIAGSPSMSSESIRYVLLCPQILSVEQGHQNRTGQMVKVISDYIRSTLSGNEFDLPYLIRRQVAIRASQRFERTLDVEILGIGEKGEFRTSGSGNKILTVSGHMIYYMIGEILGLPVGIARLFEEKKWNAYGVRGVEEGHPSGGDNGVWHYDIEDYLATECVRPLLVCMNVSIYPGNLNSISLYIEYVQGLITKLRQQCPEYCIANFQSA
jgi:hypothetical protein